MRALLTLIFVFGLLAAASAQRNTDPYVREADRYYANMAYARAAELYRTAAELGAVNEHVTKRLAICSAKLGDVVEAERWYAVVVKFLNREPIDLYNYAEALKANARYEEAELWMDRYLALSDTDGLERRSNIALFARKLQMDQDRFNVRRLSINTPGADLATAWIGPQRVVFSSSRQGTGMIKREAAWNAQPFLDLFTAEVTASGDLTNVAPLEGTVNTRYHEGPATASTSGDVLWFTRNNFYKGRARRSQRGVSRLAIYRASRANGAYTNEEQFLYNNPEVSIAHPSLSADGKRLFFASDMPGGYGGTDLYVCEFTDGQWSEPRNLGPAINTPFNESFPFIAADGSLFFASNGHPGLGGLDILRATPGQDGRYAGALNLGAPVNSARDDFAFIIDAAGKRGFFTSNRPGGMGDDDLYAFEMLAPLEERFLVTGRVIDDEHETPVADIEVRLTDLDGGAALTTTTDSKGEYTFSVRKDRTYKITARMKGRFEGEQHLNTATIERELIASRDVHLVADAGVWMRGAVREKDGPGFVSGAKVCAVNLSSFSSDCRFTGAGGDVSMRLQTNEEFEVVVEKAGYFSLSIPISTIGMRSGVIDLGQARDLVMEPIALGQPIAFKHIRWAEKSAQLDPRARAELDLLAERLGVNPSVMIEVGVHSDSRGDQKEQQELSQKRADAIAAYLAQKGVAKDRVRAKGFGATRLQNHCVPGVQCSEEEHAANRRNEYVVTSVAQ
ncbi:MAG: OmpA family protein [Flavobacteriales bacterium]